MKISLALIALCSSIALTSAYDYAADLEARDANAVEYQRDIRARETYERRQVVR